MIFQAPSDRVLQKKKNQIFLTGGDGSKKSLPAVAGDSKPETDTEHLSKSEHYGLIASCPLPAYLPSLL